MDPSDTSPPITTARASDNVNEQITVSRSKRARRPFETPPDGSVTDRRRLQNRMAQRAYRQRKDSAIDVLQQKVTELEKSKEDMSREFIKFTTLILEQNSVKDCPEIIEHIKGSTLGLLRGAGEIDDDERLNNQDTDQILPTSDLETGISTSVIPGLEQVEQFDFPMADFIAQLDCADSLGSTTNSQPNSNPTSCSHDANSYFQMPVNRTQSHHMDYQLPGAPYASSMPCPKSYAAQEITFGRRLHRAAQEGGFLLASMKHPPPTWYLKVFGFCLHFETREEICDRLGDVVRRNRDSTLNDWNYPFTNLGGAGLFYPHERGNGARRAAQLETGLCKMRHLRLDAQLRIIDPEFEGDFFDSDEVEICLRGYGVTIPPNKDFVTAYIDMAMFEREQDAVPANVRLHNPDIVADASVLGMNIDTHIDQNLEHHEPVSVHCPAGMMGMAMGRMPQPPKSTRVEEIWKTPLMRETKVTVDVERLITCLCNSTVCLGRTPAVRPKDIRKSLAASIVNNN
ncbi:hypothetical protein NM208_g4548 [Fusarium decemcellulare]|uniref:Uncharacterized protein n=1 Tax=Fusarium decemcellulare TaxID=57161 RepID=A0ACC1SKD6_9HYPO|nr:hypothetical protein NM208_g4548 [Fusarium decemcellulare]